MMTAIQELLKQGYLYVERTTTNIPIALSEFVRCSVEAEEESKRKISDEYGAKRKKIRVAFD